MDNLYQIDARLEVVFHKLETEELTPEERISLEAEAEFLHGDRDAKLVNCWKYLRSMELESEMIRIEADRLKEKRQAAEKRVENFKKYVSLCLGNSPWKQGAYKFSFVKSEAAVPLSDEDGEKTPQAYCRVKTVVEPDKKLIKETIKCGGTVPGWKLEDRYNLQVK